MHTINFLIISEEAKGSWFLICEKQVEKENMGFFGTNATVDRRTTIETNKKVIDFFRPMLTLCENVLFGENGAIYGDLISQSNIQEFLKMIEAESKLPV
jgi:hypothetical protein